MRVIAFDPGYDRCGVAILEKQKGKEVVLFSGCIETNRKDSLDVRVSDIGKEVEELILKHKPSHLALETLFFNINKKTAIDVAQARGVLLYLGGKHSLRVCEYTPSAIKVAVTGHGRSDKKQIISMIPRLVSIEKKIQHDDEWDAIAVGITCIASEKEY